MRKSKNKPDGVLLGNLFELNLYVLFLERGCRKNYRFKLSREQQDAGKFDDLVFEFEKKGENGERKIIYRLLQAKHSSNSEKKINEKLLFSDGYSNFSLINYLQSYRNILKNYSRKGEINDLIICTNYSFDFKQLKIDITKVAEEDSFLDVVYNGKKSERYRLMDTKENIYRIIGEWKKRMKNSTSEQEPNENEVRDFLKLLTFAVDMPDGSHLSTILKEEIGKEDIYNTVLHRIIDWTNGEDRRYFWTSEDAQALLKGAATRSSLSGHKTKHGFVTKNSNNKPDGVFAGMLFELNLFLLFLLRGCRKKYRFKLLIRQNDAKRFDDLFFEFEENGAKVYRLLQAKHSIVPEKKSICEQHFFSGRRGTFDLIENFLSYRNEKINCSKGEIKDLIICTNCSFDLKKLKIDIEKVAETDDILDVVYIGKKSEKYRIKNTNEIIDKIKTEWKSDKRRNRLSSETEPTAKEIKDFFNHLTFIVNMPGNSGLRSILENELGEEFSETSKKPIYNRAFQGMMDWMETSDYQDFWTHTKAEAFFENVKTLYAHPHGVCYNIQAPVSSFIGRQHELECLHELLQEEGQAMICGLGGVGKTQFVRKYIQKYRQNYCNNILWIDAEDDTSIENSFRRLASDKLGIKMKDTNNKTTKLRELIQEVYECFQYSKSLLIFDNAVWLQYRLYIRPSLAKRVRQPYIIITSRCKWRNENIIERVDLSEFTAVEATNFISKSLPKFLENGRQGDSVEKLAETLQFFPLALRQAVAYITAKFKHETDTYLLSDYIDNFSRKSGEYLDYDISKYCESKYNKTVWTTWNVTLETLQREKNYAPEVLNSLSFLLPDFIHAELLSKLFNKEDKLKDTILLLDEYSLITVRNDVYSLHRLVQLVTREKLKRDKKDRKILEKILKAIEDNDESIDRSVDHFTCAWKHFKESCKELEKYYHIPARIAVILFHGSRYTEAYSLGVEALKLMHSLSLNVKEEQQFLQEIALIIVKKLFSSGEYEEAFDKSKKILKILKDMNERFGYPVPIMFIENDILFGHLRMADFEAAFKVLNELSNNEKSLLPIEYNRKYINNAIMYHEEVLCDIAVKCFEFKKALRDFYLLFDKRKTILGVEDPGTLRAVKKMTYVFSEMHLYERATDYRFSINKRTDFVNELLSILLRAYEEQKINLPKMHNDRLDTQESIINLRIELGEYSEALELLNEVPDSRLKRNNCYMLTMKVAVLALLGKKDGTLAICEHLDGDTPTLKSDVRKHYLDIVDRRLRIALVKSLLGEVKCALDILEKIWNELKSYVSYDNVYLANTLKVIGLLYWKVNKYPQALNALYDAWIGSVNNSILSTDVSNFINMFHEKGQLDRVFSLLKFEDNTTEKLEILRLLDRIAGVYKDKKDYKNALSLLTKKKNLLENWSEENSPNYRKTCHEISELETLEKIQSTATTEDPFVAIKSGNMDQLKKLIEGGGNVNRKDKQKWTLLHHAAAVGEPEAVEYLLAKGADVNAVTEEKENTALHIATAKNRIEVVEKILCFIFHTSKKLVNAITKPSGNTALHVASREGFLDIVRLLLINGASYNVKNKAGKTPLHLAEDITVKAVLLEVDKRFRSVSDDDGTLGPVNNYSLHQYLLILRVRDWEGKSLLQLAVLNGSKKHAEEILGFKRQYCPISAVKYEAEWLSKVDREVLYIRRNSKIGSVNYLDFLDLVKPLMSVEQHPLSILVSVITDMLSLSSAEKSRSDEPRKLAKHLIDIQLERFMALLYGSALIDAAKRNDLELFKLCLDKQPTLDLRDENGMTPLHFATDSGNEEMVKLLLEKNVSSRLAEKGVTPLHLAAIKGYVEIMKLLLQCHSISIFVNSIDLTSGTPLHYAARHGHVEVVKLLLEHSACFNKKDLDGHTPADLTKNQEIKDLFKRIDELQTESVVVARVVQSLRKFEPAERRPLLNATSAEKIRLRDLIVNHKDKKDFLNVLGLENEVEQDSVLQMKSSKELRKILLEIAEKFKDSSC